MLHGNWSVTLGLPLYFRTEYGLCRADLVQRCPGPSGAHPQALKVLAVLSLTSMPLGGIRRLFQGTCDTEQWATLWAYLWPFIPGHTALFLHWRLQSSWNCTLEMDTSLFCSQILQMHLRALSFMRNCSETGKQSPLLQFLLLNNKSA